MIWVCTGGIDLTHTRLFTIYSFRKLLTNAGFTIREIRGFGSPIHDMVGKVGVLGIADAVSSRLALSWPRLFAFNFLIVAENDDELKDIYARTTASEQLHPDPD